MRAWVIRQAGGPEQLQSYIEMVEKRELVLSTGQEFAFEELVKAHHLMDANQGGGKIVVLGA